VHLVLMMGQPKYHTQELHDSPFHMTCHLHMNSMLMMEQSKYRHHTQELH
jgi:hypothetical protein